MAEANKKTKKKEVAEADLTAEAAPAKEVKEVKDGADKKDSAPKDAADTKGKEEAATAKAGKRSAKALKEAKEKEEKEARKASKDPLETEEKKPKKVVKPARSRLERRSKKYREVAKKVEKGKQYTLKEAVELARTTSTVKFDATVELHVRLGVDPRQADQNIRNNVVLPAGSGKSVRVAVFADVEDVKKAKAAGADIAGGDDFLQQLDKGQLDFDVLIATPMVMAKLGKYAKVLGPKGLMPNPKSGTVSADVTKAVKEAKAGKVEYRVDSTGIVHLGVGKTSFTTEQLLENLQAVLASIKAAKPNSVKGMYIQSMYLTTTMGPSINVLSSEV
jgi:large subunit ribosomal protein L1